MGYFAMAADLGWVGVEVEFVREDFSALAGGYPTRQVFWIRYVTWYVHSTMKLIPGELNFMKANFNAVVDGRALHLGLRPDRSHSRWHLSYRHDNGNRPWWSCDSKVI